jgi:hypothetical protein
MPYVYPRFQPLFNGLPPPLYTARFRTLSRRFDIFSMLFEHMLLDTQISTTPAGCATCRGVLRGLFSNAEAYVPPYSTDQPPYFLPLQPEFNTPMSRAVVYNYILAFLTLQALCSIVVLNRGLCRGSGLTDTKRPFSKVYRYRIPIPPSRAQRGYLLVQGKGSPKAYYTARRPIFIPSDIFEAKSSTCIFLQMPRTPIMNNGFVEITLEIIRKTLINREWREP